MSEAAVIPRRIPPENLPESIGRVLVIDDEAEIRESLETLLQLEGYVVSSAATAREGMTLLGERTVCNACAARDRMTPLRLGARGTLYNYTIVYRSFPGVKTPFVAAIVELEGGGAIKGTLIDVDPDPAALPFDMPVEVIFRGTGQTSKEGEPFISHYFAPAGKAGS